MKKKIKKPFDDPDQNVEKNTESTSALSQTPEPSVIPRKRKATMEDRRLDKAFEILKTSSKAIQDDCQHFGNLVAAKLRKFSEDVRTNLESDIMGLFVKANRGFYTHQSSNSAPETSHLSSQCNFYATTLFEPINASSISSPASAMSSEDSFNITELL